MDPFHSCDDPLPRDADLTRDVSAPDPARDAPARGDVATDGLDLEALRRLQATQPVIEQAKGMLMACYGIDADDAFRVLSRWSSRSHRKVRDLAEQLVAVAAQPDGERFGSLRRYLAEHLEA